MEVARPTGSFLPRVAETAFGTACTSSCRDQMELGGLPTPQSLQRTGQAPKYPTPERGTVGGVLLRAHAANRCYDGNST